MQKEKKLYNDIYSMMPLMWSYNPSEKWYIILQSALNRQESSKTSHEKDKCQMIDSNYH